MQARSKTFVALSILIGVMIGVGGLGCEGMHRQIEVISKFPPLEDRIVQIMQAGKNNLPDKYAVIINGDNSKLHIRNVSLAYNVLKHNGFMERNIFVLSYQNNTRDEEIQAYAPTIRNLVWLSVSLSHTVDDKDFLFIYGTGHGYTKGSGIIIRKRVCTPCKHPYPSIVVTKDMFEYLIKDIHPESALLVFDQCQAGGFGTIPQRRKNFVVITRTAKNERSTCRYFAKAFFDAFGDVSSDMDNNGRISVAEAFSKTLQTINRTDANYQKHKYTPSIKGGPDPNTIYLN